MPKRLVLTGFMGAGKTTVGVRLARELDWDFLDLDQEITRAQGQSIADIFSTAGEDRFRELEHAALVAALDRAQVIVALGGGALETAANRQRLAAQPQTLLLYLEAPLDILIARCEHQHRTEPQTARRPLLEQRPELTARFLRRQPFYQSAHWTLHTAECDIEEIVRTIVHRWKASTTG